jgi:hypothetical protein
MRLLFEPLPIGGGAALWCFVRGKGNGEDAVPVALE